MPFLYTLNSLVAAIPQAIGPLLYIYFFMFASPATDPILLNEYILELIWYLQLYFDSQY